MEGCISAYEKRVLNQDELCAGIELITGACPQDIKEGKFALLYTDVLKFKAVNAMFGRPTGDALLKHIGDTMLAYAKEGELVCRLNADRFLMFVRRDGLQLDRFVQHLLDDISDYEIRFQITCNMGIYVTGAEDDKMSPPEMMDRAILAQSAIKGSFTTRHYYYRESLRRDMLSEQELVGMMTEAIAEQQFVAYYQPQYESSTGSLIGAEALVRWKHPTKGLVPPSVFIPIFEKNGFVTNLDCYVFEEVCIFLRKCMDNHLPMVAIATNFSRKDIFKPGFVEGLEYIRKRYEVPVKYLRIEITESATEGHLDNVVEIIDEFHKYGYLVELDDFGSGYSSLNVLKDLDVDVVKLDMDLLNNATDNHRGGIIVSSIMRMAKWLSLPVIMEGVETDEQLLYLRSIGCDYIQGYLFSKPLPEAAFVELLQRANRGELGPKLEFEEDLAPLDVWDMESLENLVFHRFMGPACLFAYRKGRVEILRANDKYIQEISTPISKKDLFETDPLKVFDEENRSEYVGALLKALRTHREQECETWRNYKFDSEENAPVCVRSTIHYIGERDRNYLFYTTIRNVTAEKAYDKIKNTTA